MITIWVCDDNERMAVLTAKFIERELQRKKTDFRCDIFTDANDLKDLLIEDNKSPDILFVAVRMRGMDGITVSKLFKEKYCTTLIVFVSAFEDALEMAAKSKPFACILKKNLNIEISYFIDKALLKIRCGKNKALSLVSRGRSLHIPADKISYFLCFNKAIIIHTVDGQEFIVRDSLKRLYSSLYDNGFCMINRGVLVNCTCVRNLYGRELILNCGTRFNCSRSGCALIKDKLKK